MDDFKAKLQALKEKRKRASHSNYKEVLEENERSKRPANWENKLERDKKKLHEEEERQRAEKAGKSYELVKSLDQQADELERWDRIKASKKRQDPGFIDFETTTRRQYGRLVKQLKPDLDDYTAQREELDKARSQSGNQEAPGTSGDGSGAGGSSVKSTGAKLIKDSREGVERMVEDVNKQIEIRGKRSRRRRFDDDADVDYINERNMRFNKKLERFYAEHTDEIKQNFERGTAL